VTLCVVAAIVAATDAAVDFDGEPRVMFSHTASRLNILPLVSHTSPVTVAGLLAALLVISAKPANAQTATNQLRGDAQYANQQIQIHIPGQKIPASQPHRPRGTQNTAAQRGQAVSTGHAATSTPPNTRKTNPQTRPASLVRQAAHGQLVEELPPRDMPRVQRAAVAQASHLCGCDQCASAHHGGQFGHGEIVCGAEPTCGITGGCDDPHCCEPTCGLEVGCGIEPSCGVAVSCGVEPGCGGYGCDVGSCNDCVGIHLPILRIDWRRFEFFAGVNAFTGPPNHATDATGRRGGSGSFGFYEGFNEGRSLNRFLGLDLSGQFGLRATQSSLSGAEFTEDARKQIFLTGGLFRRVDFGLQYGVVVDYLYDDWWYRSDLVQVRGELSWNDNCGHEFGYQVMGGTSDSTSSSRLIDANNVVTVGTVTFEATTQHRLFLRGATARGASYHAFAGGSDQGDGILGGTLTSAFRNRFAVQGGVTYLIPTESNRAGGYENEAWSLSMGIVFRPGGKQGAGRYCRPMFDVADNGTFMVDRL